MQKIDGKIKRINQENSTIKVWDDMRNNISGLSILSGQIYMYHWDREKSRKRENEGKKTLSEEQFWLALFFSKYECAKHVFHSSK